MQHGEFRIGETFWCSGQRWRCTDIGTRTIVAICIDRVQVGSTDPELRRTLSNTEAETDGWFNGPPYAVLEHVFDEDGIVACSLVRDDDTASAAATDAGESAESAAPRRAQVSAIREQTRTGGLRFEAYLPPDLAGWLLDLIERGVFTDPGEATFVMLGEQRELEPHADLREEVLRRSLQAAIDDPRPSIPHEEVVKKMRALMAAPRPEPAVWRRAL
jgi:hypothetical protein